MSDDGVTGAVQTSETSAFAITRLTPAAAAGPPVDPQVEAERQQAEQTMRAADELLSREMTRDDAIKLRSQLMADDGWAKRFLEGSPDRLKQIQKINSIINKNPNLQSEQSREIERMRVHYDLPSEAVDHLRENKAVSAAEKYVAQQKKRELMSDPVFVRAYMAGSLNEQRTMTMLNIIAASPLLEAQ
jgi:hypothetical protein